MEVDFFFYEILGLQVKRQKKIEEKKSKKHSQVTARRIVETGKFWIKRKEVNMKKIKIN